jgi:DNA-binding MarR family transcriptional regulator
MREARARLLERWGLSLRQFDVLAELGRRAGDGLTFAKLSHRLIVTSGNLTGIVDQLEARQLVRRYVDPRDRRSFHVRLTKEGRFLTKEILLRHRNDLHELMAFIPLERLVRLTSLLDALRHGLSLREELQPPPRDQFAKQTPLLPGSCRSVKRANKARRRSDGLSEN